MENKKRNILLSKETIDSRIQELGKEITKDYEGKSIYVLSLLRGSFIFTADLVRALDTKVKVGFMTTSSYGHSENSSGEVKIVSDIPDNIEGYDVLIVDDIVDTAGSLVEGAKALKEFGAKSVMAAVTHAVLTDPASERIANSNIKELIVTNTMPLPENCKLPNVTQLSVAPLLGEAIMRIFHEVSVSNLFDK